MERWITLLALGFVLSGCASPEETNPAPLEHNKTALSATDWEHTLLTVPISDSSQLTLSSQAGERPMGPQSVDLSADGALRILDTASSRILEFDWSGELLDSTRCSPLALDFASLEDGLATFHPTRREIHFHEANLDERVAKLGAETITSVALTQIDNGLLLVNRYQQHRSAVSESPSFAPGIPGFDGSLRTIRLKKEGYSTEIELRQHASARVQGGHSQSELLASASLHCDAVRLHGTLEDGTSVVECQRVLADLTGSVKTTLYRWHPANAPAVLGKTDVPESWSMFRSVRVLPRAVLWANPGGSGLTVHKYAAHMTEVRQ